MVTVFAAAAAAPGMSLRARHVILVKCKGKIQGWLLLSVHSIDLFY